MRGHASRVKSIVEFLYRNRVGGAMFAVLYIFGICFGHAFYQEVYRDSIVSTFLQLGTLKAGLPLGQVLLSTALPAFLYICCMLLCAYEKYAIVLWGLCQLFAGMRIGTACGIIISMELWWALPMQMLMLLAQLAVSLLCLDCRAVVSADAYKITDRFLLPATIYLMLALALQLLMAALVSRILLH